MIYLIDTTIGKKRILKEPNMKFYDKQWLNAVCGEYIAFSEDGIVAMTYHYFGHLVERYQGFANQFELILCDEIHNAIYFGNIRNNNEENYARIAREEIDRLVQRDTAAKVIGITATPDIIKEKFSCPINNIHVDNDVYRYETKNILTYRNINNIIPQLDKRKTGLIYTAHVKQMKELVKAAEQRDIKAIAIWRVNNDNNPMNDEQYTLWRYIVEEEKLPPQYDLVVINAACGTAINIRSHVDYMVVNSQISDTITQARGRVRDDLELLYHIDMNIKDKINVEIPLAFIGLPLYQAQKDMLCELLPVFDSRGRRRKWNTLKYYIEQSGYTITTDSDKKRKSYDLINV